VAASPVVRVVRIARRRLFVQALVNRLVAGWAAALLLGLVWLLAEPLLLAAPPERLRWWVLAGLAAVAAAAAVVRTVRRFPPRLAVALEVDSRFDLKERTTTALGLPAELQPTPAGRAVLADADDHARGLRVRDRFPVRVGWKVLWLPALAGLLAVVAFVYHPVADSGLLTASKSDEEKAATNRTANASKKTPYDARPKPKPDVADRANRSREVQELQDELARLEAAARPGDQDAARERVTAITSAEEKAKALEREKADRLARLENKLGRLGKLSEDQDFKGGPAQELNDALAQGDLDKARAAADDLAKQLRDPNLDPQKKEQLQKQLDKMSDELRRAAANQDKIDDLNKRIADAKAMGADTSGLEQELAQAKADAEKSKGAKELADKLDAAKQSLQDGKPDEAAKQLDDVAKQVDAVKGEVQDVKDLQDQQKRLNDLKADATKAGEPQPGQQPGQQPGGSKSDAADPKPIDNAKGGGTGAGSRPENPSANLGRGPDERQRVPFDGKGKQTYSGPVAGSGYVRKSPAELGPAIDRAVQEAPDAVAGQPLSRDDKDAVKEFYRDFPKK
jgi:hypothetical protein